MANTPRQLSFEQRNAADLLEDFCLQLRYVGCNDRDLPAGERVLSHVRAVCQIHNELVRRHIDYEERLERLTVETGWQMPGLLKDCLAYPKIIPYVRDLDGIRRALRCELCSREERPADSRVFWYCDSCMHAVIAAIDNRLPVKGIVLFRTYNAECRCRHADEETVLACADYDSEYYFEGFAGVCKVCIAEELDRRMETPG